MAHHDHHADIPLDSSSGGDTPDIDPLGGIRRAGNGFVDVGWLRPYRAPLGRPRGSTVILLLAWIALFALYVAVRPG